MNQIPDASWGRFIQLLSYKAERAGRRVVKISPGGRIKNWGLGQPCQPVERRPLLRVPAQAVVTGQASSVKQKAPPLTAG